MKKAIPAVLALYVLAYVGVSFLHHSMVTKMNVRYARALELGEQHAPLPNDDQQPLAEACRGKLTPGSTRSIASYVAKMKYLPSLGESYWHVDRTLLGVSDVLFLNLTDRFFEDLTVAPHELGASFKELANPVDWSNHLKWASVGSPEFGEVRYLIVARYDSLTMPTVTDSGFLPGTGAFGAKVLRFPEGDVICEGRSAVRMKNSVAASGRGRDSGSAQIDADANARRLVPFVFTESVTRTPLADLCEAGGSELCKLTSEWVSPTR